MTLTYLHSRSDVQKARVSAMKKLEDMGTYTQIAVCITVTHQGTGVKASRGMTREVTAAVRRVRLLSRQQPGRHTATHVLLCCVWSEYKRVCMIWHLLHLVTI